MKCDDILAIFARPADPAAVEAAFGVPLAFGQSLAQRELDAGARQLRNAQRYVLSPLIVETVAALADPIAVDRTRDYLFLPAANFWMEWDGELPGAGGSGAAIHLVAEGDSYRLARLTIYLPVRVEGQRLWVSLVGMVDLAGDGPIVSMRHENVDELARLAGVPVEIARAAVGRFSARLFGATIGAALALINTPRLTNAVDRKHEKINAARMKNGRPPLLEYKEIAITPDLGLPGRGNPAAASDGRSLHHVRSHLRLKKGRVELVRAHMRGDPLRGVIIHRHVVRRQEDEGRAWKGGELPPKRIITELFEPDQE